MSGTSVTVIHFKLILSQILRHRRRTVENLSHGFNRRSLYNNTASVYIDYDYYTLVKFVNYFFIYI